MATLKEQILKILERQAGLTDREITDRVKGRNEPQQSVNQACHQLEAAGVLVRQRRDDGLIGNFLFGHDNIETFRSLRSLRPVDKSRKADGLSEDEIKRSVASWLETQGWDVHIAWGRSPGIDIDATKGRERWIIEAKGVGAHYQARHNYFTAIIGSIIERMDNGHARYSIALPDIAQFRSRWARLPGFAKQRTGITALFVAVDGRVILER